MSNTNKADVIRKKWHPAGWMPAGFREMWEYAVDLERFLNAAECRIQDLEQAAPQAQEETRGAPAVGGSMAVLGCSRCGERFIDPNNHTCAPAPASPDGLVWTKEKPTRPGWYIRRAVSNKTGRAIGEEPRDWDAILYERPMYVSDPRSPEIRFEWAGPFNPAIPEAGAPAAGESQGAANG